MQRTKSLIEKEINRPPPPPGVLFERDILPELTRPRRTLGEIAALLGVSRQTLHRVMRGESAITLRAEKDPEN